mgnify:CR=1 FL=1
MIPSCGQCELHWQPQAFVERIAENGITAAFARDWQNLCDTSLKQGCWPVVSSEFLEQQTSPSTGPRYPTTAPDDPRYVR